MRVAVLGCGSIGRRHLQNLLTLNYRDLILYDPSAVIRDDIGRQYNIEAFDQLEDVWHKDPQIVFITSPTQTHIELALESARHNCHIFIEKPISYSNVGLQQLCSEVKSRGLVTMVGCNMRFHPGPATVNRLLSERTVGRVLAARIQTGSYLPRWRPTQNYKESYSASPEWGGAVLDCIHEIDLALWYSGPAELLYATTMQADSLGLETDGLAEILLRHHDGVLTSVHLNFVQRDYRRTCQIIGDEGTIYWDFEKRKVEIYGSDGNLMETIDEPRDWNVNEMYVDELRHFLKCAENKVPTVNPVERALAAFEIALAARLSACDHVTDGFVALSNPGK